MTPTMTTIILAAVFAIPAISNGSSKWALHGVESGVTVFTSQVAGSAVPKVRAIAEVPASTDKVWSYITGQNFKVKGLKEKKSVGNCGTGCELTYVRIGYPFIDDRHYVAQIVSSVEDKDGAKLYHRKWREVSGQTPSSVNAIIVEMVDGSWTLEPVDGGTKTKITYENHIDLGGDLPPSLFKGGFINSAYTILQNIIAKN